jgi:hypothetical protein
MGPGEPPLFPEYPVLSAPEEFRFTCRWHSSCNYLQGNEGNLDPVHTSYLHRYDLAEANSYSKTSVSVFAVDTAPRLSVRPTSYGLRIYAEREMPGTDKRILRVTNFVMPNACAIGGFESGLGRGGASMFWHVPIDDTHHWRMEFTFHSKKPLPRDLLEKMYALDRLPDGTSRRTAENRYLQNRDRMNSEYTGMGQNFPSHDLFVTESQGAILDRTQENLVTSDIGIVHARRQLLNAIADVQAGKDPVGVCRNPAQASFRDLLVLTETLDSDVDNDKFCSELERQNIYALNEEIVRREPAPAPAE